MPSPSSFDEIRPWDWVIAAAPVGYDIDFYSGNRSMTSTDARYFLDEFPGGSLRNVYIDGVSVCILFVRSLQSAIRSRDPYLLCDIVMMTTAEMRNA